MIFFTLHKEGTKFSYRVFSCQVATNILRCFFIMSGNQFFSAVKKTSQIDRESFAANTASVLDKFQPSFCNETNCDVLFYVSQIL